VHNAQLKTNNMRKIKLQNAVINQLIKSSGFILLTSIIMLTTGCTTPAENVENAKSDVQTAEEDLNKANEEFQKDVIQFKVEMKKAIASNEKTIEELKVNIKTSNAKDRAAHEKQIERLELKNNDLKTTIADYKGESNNDWLFFKSEFNKDMDTLGSALKNFFSKNK
jgi:TolA-binding protein